MVADKLAELRAAHGPDSVGVFGGGGLTNEKAYQLGKFARVALGTSQIDYNGRWCMSSAASAGTRAFGLDRGLPFPLADLEQTDVLVLVGSNLAETMPPAARHLVNLRARGGKVVLIDPRRTSTADKADVFVQPVPGTDLALAQTLLHLVIAGGWVDEEYVATRTTGFQPVKDSVASWWPERAERVTGVPAGELRDLARLLGEADKVMILTARGAEQHASGSDTVLAWINLALALGQCGTEFAGYGCLTGQGNGQGGREHGQKADQLPGLPDDRRPGGSRARCRRVGSRAGFPARQGQIGLRAPRGTGPGRRAQGAAGLRQQHHRVRTERQPCGRATRRSRPSGGRRHGDVRDCGARGRRTPDHAVGRGDRHDDQPRRPGDPAQPGDQPRRPGCAATSRSSAGWPSGSLADRLLHRPGGGLHRARPGLGRWQGRLQRHHLPADPRRARRVLAVPGLQLDQREASRDAADVPRRVRHPGRAGPLPSGRAPRRGGAARRRLPGASHDRAGAGAVPVRRPDSSGAAS